jgi:mannose-6-phosphate isomerase-like protein (cupin superfamily)
MKKMYNVPSMYPYQNQFYNYVNVPFNNYERQQNVIKDFGAEPFVVNINNATKQNKTFRSALWTGNQLQVTLMSLNVGEDIGLEMHSNVDQFLRVEQGQGIVQMGKSKDNLDFKTNVYDDFAIIIPAGTWHNLTNSGNIPLKLYSIYAPPNHPFGTVHVTKADAIAAEEANGHHNRPVNSFTTSKNNFTKEEAAAIALLLGIDFTKSKFNLNEFWMGVNTELEHGRIFNLTNVTSDEPLTTGKIALAHLNEFPDYYRRLKVLEEEAKAYWNK